MPFGFPKRPSKPTAKGVTESAVKKTAVTFLLSPIGLTIIGVALALAFMLIMITSVVGKASTDPMFAAQVGLDAFFGNTPQTTIAPPPPANNSCSSLGGTCKTSCATNETQNTSVTDCTQGQLCCVANGGGLAPGEFKPPFMCSPKSKYWGLTYTYPPTYPAHTHWAVDFNRGSGSDDLGDPVYAVADGIVEDIISGNGEVWIGHKGDYMTAYAHMRKILVKQFDHVKVGQQIGEIGNVDSTTSISPHLHFHVCGHWAGCFVADTKVTVQIKFNNIPYPVSCYSCNKQSSPNIDCNWP